MSANVHIDRKWFVTMFVLIVLASVVDGVSQELVLVSATVIALLLIQ